MKAGDVLDGRYEIVRPVGRGGMGAVYEAIQRDLGRRVAVKVLEDGAEVARLAQEARALAALNHPNVVTILDSRPQASPPFLAMDLVPGRSLQEVIAESGRLEPRRAAVLAIQLLSALGAAHQAGIIHRDVKPSNVLVVDGGPMNELVKVVDFGIAKLMIDPLKQTTRGVVVGSLAYMAPEQIFGKPLDPRVDLFAAGVTLYEMLGGRPPFDGESAPRVVAAICQDEPPVLVAPPALVAIVQRAMQKDASARFATADEMRRALETFVTASPGHHASAAGASALASTAGPSALAFTAGPSALASTGVPPDAFAAPRTAIAPTAPMAAPIAPTAALPVPPGAYARPEPLGSPRAKPPMKLTFVAIAFAAVAIVAVAIVVALKLTGKKVSPTVYDGSTVAIDIDAASHASQAEEDAIRRRLSDFARCFRTTNLPRGSTMKVEHLQSVALIGAKNGVDLSTILCAEGVDQKIVGVRPGVAYRVRF